MKNSIMPRLNYISMPNYDTPDKYREFLKKSSNYQCVYCTITESENPGATFNIDHFKPKKIFPQYYSDCTNLRYACPRCNSYKRARWISEKDGCIRNCEVCNNKICHENIDRFIDNLYDYPEDIICLKNDFLFPINDSRPARYTIDSLRLNRIQLVKLRKIRRYIDVWKEELAKQEKLLRTQLINIISKKKEFEELITEKQHDCKNKVILTMFELLEAELEKEQMMTKEQIRKIECIQVNKYSGDNIIK